MVGIRENGPHIGKPIHFRSEENFINNWHIYSSHLPGFPAGTGVHKTWRAKHVKFDEWANSIEKNEHM